MKLFQWILNNTLRIPLLVISVLATLLLISAHHNQLARANCAANLLGTEVTGNITEISYRDPSTTQVVISRGAQGKVLATVASINLELGGRYQFRGMASLPKNSAEFNYKDYLATQGICQLFEIKEVRLLEASSTIEANFARLKAQLLSKVQAVSPQPLAALTAGLVLGEDHLFTPQQQSEFRALGLSHVTAVSGANFILVIAFVQKVTAKLPHKLAWLMLLLVAIGYLLLLGSSNLAAARACIFVCSQILQKLSGRIWSSFLTATSALLLLELIDRGAYLDLGLQLSFLAWFLLRLFLGKLLDRFALVPEIIRAEFLAALFASLLLLPLNLIYFGEVNLVSLGANLLLLAIFSLKTYLSWFWLGVLVFAGGIGELLVGYFTLLAQQIFNLVSYLAQFQLKLAPAPELTNYLVLAYLGLILAYIFKRLQPYVTSEVFLN